MKTNHEFVARIVEEKRELDDKLMRLMAFLHSPEYMAVSREERLMLLEQATQMAGYSVTLLRRYMFHEKTKAKRAASRTPRRSKH